MSSNIEQITSLANSALQFLDKAASDEDSMLMICEEVSNSFREIIMLADDNISNINRVKFATAKFWKFLMKMPNAFNNHPEQTPMISQFFIEFVPFSGKVRQTEEIANFYMKIILSCPDSAGINNCFAPSIRFMVEVDTVREEFLSKYLIKCFSLVLKGNSNLIIDTLFDALSSDDSYYKKGKSATFLNDFIGKAIEAIPKYSAENFAFLYEFLHKLLSSDISFLDKLIATGYFKKATDYVISHQDQLYYEIKPLSRFCQFTKDPNNTLPPAVTSILSIVDDPKLQPETQTNIFAEIKTYVEKAPILIIKPESILALINKVSINDEKPFHILVDLVFSLTRDPSYDLSILIPPLLKYCDYETAMKHNISQVYNLFLIMDSRFAPKAEEFYTKYVHSLTFDQYNDLIR